MPPTPAANDNDNDITIHTSTLFDPKQKRFLTNTTLTVSPTTGLITSIHPTPSPPPPSTGHTIDLRSHQNQQPLTILPGLVDAHTHIFLHPYAEAAALVQKRDESAAERILRAANHARAGLLAGYTTYRDLGSEGMGDADARVRDAVARGIVAGGPRMFVATRALAGTGGYEVRSENAAGDGCCGGGGGGVTLPAGGEAVDGVLECRKAVRRRIAAGADVVKFYADYRRRMMRWPPAQQHPYVAGVLCPPEVPNPDVMVLDEEEMDAIVREARLAKCPVAAHCGSVEAGLAAVRAGATTVEHGYFASEELFEEMVKRKTIFVPTLAVCERLHQHRFGEILANAGLAYKMGVRFAAGGDTGTFPHGENVREVELMIEAGMPLEDALESCTVGGWEACGGDWCGVKFGWFEPGCRADIIALEGDPREDLGALRRVSFVMKDGKVWKKDGEAVGMI
ncbi:amidohydrolase domain containing protein [Diplodia corticola]|uniref:Amidohydrolase domain containing protein n=1 Tax=Diplodia corticola TaxID=236234 RepID=A0A1J9QM97_9PEZI|nr:amidohydrolase domain containing protein [Diplodia corticola]OJD29608.1 amidohydrolase domain containing protein [Diplodia corticola]